MAEINFFKGYASNELFPREQLDKSFRSVLLGTNFDVYNTDPENQHPLNYGTDPGNLQVRKSIAEWSTRNFGVDPIDPDCLNLTNGASFGIADILLSCADTNVTRRAFIVSPCYYLINFAFVDVGLGDKISGIKETPGGKYDIDIAELERQLEALDGTDYSDEEPHVFSDELGRPAKKVYSSVIYIVPTYSNPGGLTYSRQTREKLIQLARRHDMLIVCDDVYELLNYADEAPVKRMCYLDRETLPPHKTFGNVLSNASTSKLVAPGLRFGWVESATPKLAFQLSQIGAIKSGGTASQLTSFVIRDLIDSGEIGKIIDNYKTVYKKRAGVLKEYFKRLPASTKIYGGNGGYFFWVVFDDAIDHKKVVEALASKNVILACGEQFEVLNNKKGWHNCVRVCFSFLNEDDIRKGMEIWIQELKAMYPEFF